MLAFYMGLREGERATDAHAGSPRSSQVPAFTRAAGAGKSFIVWVSERPGRYLRGVSSRGGLLSGDRVRNMASRISGGQRHRAQLDRTARERSWIVDILRARPVDLLAGQPIGVLADQAPAPVPDFLEIDRLPRYKRGEKWRSFHVIFFVARLAR